MKERLQRPLAGRSLAGKGTGLSQIALIVIALALAVPAAAQEQPASAPEIPLTFRPPYAARYAGMGGISIALADDHTAALSNPATLGLVRSIEFAAGFTHQDGRRDVTRLGNLESTEFGKTRISHLGVAYPFPTYRGSLVVGFAYGRMSPLDSDYFQSGTRNRADYEGIYEEGSLNAYSAAVALQVTPEITVGAAGTILGGHDYWERSFQVLQGQDLVRSYTTTEAEISGVTGSLGALAQFDNGLRLGIEIHLPEGLTLDGSGVDSADFSFSNEIKLPYKIGAGLAFARNNLIMGMDAIYTDWTQIDYYGPVRTPDREFAYRETVELRTGGELLLSSAIPIRVRAGYTYQPLPYRVLLTDVFDRPYNYEPARFEKGRQYVTVGAGVLLARSLTLDVAYMHGGFKRSGETTPAQIYQEEEKDRRLLASLSLRLR